MKFSTWYDNLHLDELCDDAERLQTVKQWCIQNVSSDQCFMGKREECYQNYLELIRYYLDDFLPNISRNLAEKIVAFDNRTALQEAARLGFDHFLKTKIPQGTGVNECDVHGMTALHFAAIKGHYHCVEALLALGADLRISNKQKQYPLFSALIFPIFYDAQQKQGKIQIYTLLKKRAPDLIEKQDDAGDTLMHLMAVHGLSELLEELIKTYPALVKVSNKQMQYPIHVAILNDQDDCVKRLGKRRECAHLLDSHGWNALHYAARYSGKEIVEICCSFIHDVDCKDRAGRTPLMLAAEVGNLDAMSSLIAHKAKTTAKDEQGWTLLHHAVHGGHPNAVAWLLKHTTVDLKARDCYHHTASDLSRIAGNEPISDLLIHHVTKHHLH